MRDNTRLRKVRVIMKSNKTKPVFGVVIPSSIAERWNDILVTVKESGNSIVLESGAKPSVMSQDELNQKTERVGFLKV